MLICILHVTFSRPETSFLWFTSPFKTLRYIIWRNYKWYFIIGLLILLLILLLFLFIYSFPVSIHHRSSYANIVNIFLSINFNIRFGCSLGWFLWICTVCLGRVCTDLDNSWNLTVVLENSWNLKKGSFVLELSCTFVKSPLKIWVSPWKI